ncbi:MAG TPA: penicillin-binding protein [Desulfuromonas sp.]|nr:penicillin-binding protein [Desulfuromonas sp.]
MPVSRNLVFAFILLLLTLVPAAHAEEAIATSTPLLRDYSSIKVFDRRGQFVGRILSVERHWVTLDRIPLFLQQALLAVEDSRFYEHGGIDMRGVARALVTNVGKGSLAQGGSTITQQLVKNKHLTGEKTLDRKVKEGFLAMEYETKYSKDQILEMYFNEIYYGNGAWGIAQAARLYFDKQPEELNEAECAVLAGVPKNPGRYNPRGKAEEVERRKAIVLARMVAEELLTAEQVEALRAVPLVTAPLDQAPAYLAQIRRQLVADYGEQVIEQGGMEVVAALDLKLQLLAEKTIGEGVAKLNPELQGALICLEPQSGDLLAVVGSVDYAKSAYNRALVAARQPGSALKPLIYAAALEAGIAASSRWDDTPVSYKQGQGQRWTPRNYGGESFGSLTLREALAHSGNVITVKLLDKIGAASFADFAGRFGLNLRRPANLSLALGTDDVTLHDLTRAYAPFANGGQLPAPRTLLSVYNRRDNAWREVPLQLTAVLSPESAFITSRMLQEVLTSGTARGLKAFAAERPLAGKTGTTDDGRDAWFIGYTPQLLTGVWVGYDQPRLGGKGFTGGAIAAPLWERFMRVALAGVEVRDFAQPEGVISVDIDPISGGLATPACPHPRREYYRAWSEPTQPCPLHAVPPAIP